MCRDEFPSYKKGLLSTFLLGECIPQLIFCSLSLISFQYVSSDPPPQFMASVALFRGWSPSVLVELRMLKWQCFRIIFSDYILFQSLFLHWIILVLILCDMNSLIVDAVTISWHYSLENAFWFSIKWTEVTKY